MVRWVLIALVLFSGFGIAQADELCDLNPLCTPTPTPTPTNTPTPTETHTPTPTFTPTNDYFVEVTTEAGEPARIERRATVGDLSVSLLLFAILVSMWVMYIANRLRGKGD